MTNGEYTKMKKFDISLSTFVPYVEEFRFWVNAAGSENSSVARERISVNVCHRENSDLFHD